MCVCVGQVYDVVGVIGGNGDLKRRVLGGWCAGR